jgi:hypothetical protein
MMKLLNAFSFNMVKNFPCEVKAVEVSANQAASMLEGSGYESAVGHADTANVFANVLGIVVPCNRATIALSVGDMAIVGQYKGPRLPEGTKELPEGASIQWILVEVSQ